MKHATRQHVVSARLTFGTQLSTRSYDVAVPESVVNAAKRS